ncbi:hypothetical protein [Acidovorax sp. Q11]
MTILTVGIDLAKNIFAVQINRATASLHPCTGVYMIKHFNART